MLFSIRWIGLYRKCHSLGQNCQLRNVLSIYKFHRCSNASTIHSPPPTPLPLHQCWSTTEKRLGNRPAFKATLTEGEGVVKGYYSPDSVFFKGDYNTCICAKFTFFSTSFVQDCSYTGDWTVSIEKTLEGQYMYVTNHGIKSPKFYMEQ